MLRQRGVVDVEGHTAAELLRAVGGVGAATGLDDDKKANAICNPRTAAETACLCQSLSAAPVHWDELRPLGEACAQDPTPHRAASRRLMSLPSLTVTNAK